MAGKAGNLPKLDGGIIDELFFREDLISENSLAL